MGLILVFANIEPSLAKSAVELTTSLIVLPTLSAVFAAVFKNLSYVASVSSVTFLSSVNAESISRSEDEVSKLLDEIKNLDSQINERTEQLNQK